MNTSLLFFITLKERNKEKRDNHHGDLVAINLAMLELFVNN